MFGQRTRTVVSDSDVRHALRSFDVPFIALLATRLGQTEGDTKRYHDLQNRIVLLERLPERIESVQQCQE